MGHTLAADWHVCKGKGARGAAAGAGIVTLPALRVRQAASLVHPLTELRLSLTEC